MVARLDSSLSQNGSALVLLWLVRPFVYVIVGHHKIVWARYRPMLLRAVCVRAKSDTQLTELIKSALLFHQQTLGPGLCPIQGRDSAWS